MQDNVGIIGAGNIGSNLAFKVAESGLADAFLMDKLNELAVAKVKDIQDALALSKTKNTVHYAGDYNDFKNCEIIVITAGMTRRPGQTREDLLKSNAEIIKDIVTNLKNSCKDCALIVVTNPLDVMSYLAYKISGFNPGKILGMAGALDSARFAKFIKKEKGEGIKKITPFVLGSHGDSMVCLTGHTLVDGKPLNETFSKGQLRKIIELTKNEGAEIVKGYKTTSAYFGPTASIYAMLYAMLKNKKDIICASCFLNGEYGLKDLFIGVPAIINRDGVKKIIELDLNEEEKSAFYASAEEIRKTIEELKL